MILPLESWKYSTKIIDLKVYSRDAGFYRIEPEIICYPENDNDIIKLFNWANKNYKNITFRAAGTSLSGQSVGNCVIADITRHFNKFSIVKNGLSIISQPGARGGLLNKALIKYERKIGPDPASIDACTIGGIVANNSSGMRSGIINNAYNSIKSLKYILPNGLEIDSSNSSSTEKFRESAKDIFELLSLIKNEIICNPNLYNKIESVFNIKNTIGYSLNSFLEYSNPLDIMTGLMTGSEGTLGFISEIEIDTLVENKYKFLSIVFYDDINSACRDIIKLRNSGASAIEFMDKTSLEVISGNQKFLGAIQFTDSEAALLVEYSTVNHEDLDERAREFKEIVSEKRHHLFFDNKSQVQLWDIRKSLLPYLGLIREKNSTLIIEDIAIDINKLNEAIIKLKGLFKKYSYTNTAIYGHGLDGNLHFILSQKFDNNSEITRYSRFMDDLSYLVVDELNGSLKAEHGTGRNMAPYVRKVWGDELYQIMVRIKNTVDPNCILNPDVLISHNEKIHISNLKSFPDTNELIHSCIECGFCESACPSRELTLTPRQRIILERELVDDSKLKKSIKEDINYYSYDTCATDGMCEIKCPLHINTGKFVKLIREQSISNFAKNLSEITVSNFSMIQSLVKASIPVIKVLSNTKISKNSAPNIYENTDSQKSVLKYHISNPDFIYFPCCNGRTLTNDSQLKPQYQVLIEISQKAGIRLRIPKYINDYCCGMAFHSKGYMSAYKKMLVKTIKMLYNETLYGRIPVIMDTTSCTSSLKSCKEFLDEVTFELYKSLQIIDVIDYLHDYLLPKLRIEPLNQSVGIHHTCASEKLGLNQKMESIANKCSTNVFVPINNTCCGFAGDRGFYYPELPKSALKYESDEVNNSMIDEFYSSNISCESALINNTGKSYKSIIYLVDKAYKNSNEG